MAKRKQLAWLFNQDNCIGCRACEAGCKQEFSLPVGVRRREVIIRESGAYPRPATLPNSMACNHCEEPACLKACPTKAYTKREKDGVVVHDQSKCVGCRRCMWACPYGAPRFDESKQKVDKCSFCAHRIDRGLPPACVVTCMGLALEQHTVEELEKRRDLVREVEGFADPELTNPSIRFRPARRGGR